MADQPLLVSLRKALTDLRAGRHEVVQVRCLDILREIPAQPQARAMLRAAALGGGDRGRARAAAGALARAGAVGDALEVLAALIRADPRDTEAWRALGVMQIRAGDVEGGERSLRQGLGYGPDDASLLIPLGISVAGRGRHDEAAALTERAVAACPESLAARWADLSIMPRVYGCDAEVARWRSRYRASLAVFAETCAEAGPGFARASLHHAQDAFYSHYACADDDVDLQRTFGHAIHGLVASAAPELVAPLQPTRRGGPMRVAFVSSMWRGHTVSRLFGSWIRELDREQFTVDLWQLGRSDATTVALGEGCSRVEVRANGSPLETARAIRASQPDAVVFPELGMDPRVLVVAAARLAPLQAMAWGHPVTSGLPTVDAFLTSASMEPEDGERAVTESLVRLPGLGVGIRRPAPPPRETGRASFGLAPEDIVYLCTQSIFKLLPRGDAFFARVAAAVPAGRFVFRAADDVPGGPQFRARLQAAFRAAGADPAAIITVGSLPYPLFQDLNAVSDVFLDGPDWSGGVTTIDALAAGSVPVTTWGPLMRMRHTAAILTELGVADTIGADVDDAVEIAVRLGRDPEWRTALRSRLTRALADLWDDDRSVRALETWLLEARR